MRGHHAPLFHPAFWFNHNHIIYDLQNKFNKRIGALSREPSKNYHLPHRHICFSPAQPMSAIPNEPTQKGETIMSSKNSNKLNVPEARAAMDKFKMEAANEVGVNLKDGYNGHLTSREAGSVGGQMVKKMIESYEKNL
jgi:small acid-soluble spore protein D (minor alpha/beta-type SASP)